jgi:spectinomycin phosphotransferase/16S rRNA (guanine(1405)-N(7))-methyltransferase
MRPPGADSRISSATHNLARVFTKPGDLPESALAETLDDLWGIRAASLEYQAVGFGSHHWLVTDMAGRRLFATVDDLAAKLHTATDTTGAAFGRLTAAFGTALALRTQAGLSFVTSPLTTADGQFLARLCDRYSLVVHPYLTGKEAGHDGEFASDDDRRTVVGMLIQVHAARVGQPRADDFVVPKLDTLQTMMATPGDQWHSGPYAQAAQKLLRAHVNDLRLLVTAYQDLARRVASRPERMVITHGEPHASNVIVTSDGLALVDWDTALLAPPERDLHDLAAADPSLLDGYTTATGTGIDEEALTLYRLWYDLAEIASYLSLFRSVHHDTADTSESWKNLRHFLRPAERWPRLLQTS